MILMPLIAAVAVLQTPAPKLTLDDALKIGSTHAFAVRQAQNRVDKATYNEKASRRALGPSVSLGANYTYQKLDFANSNTGPGFGARKK